MINKTILIGILLLTCAISLANTPPNILLIIADDMGADVTPGYNIGTNLPNTPNIEKLAQNGLTFKNVWATPVCAATRAAIMTGKYGVNNGVNTVPGVLDTEHTSIFNQLKSQTDNAYATCLVGKWHLAQNNDLDHPYEHGLDDFMGLLGAGVTDYYNWEKVENGQKDSCHIYATSYLTDYAVNWINQQDQPWLMWMGHFTPHAPFHLPPDGTYNERNGTSNMKKYLSMIENLDYEIGRLLDSIPPDVLENTLIIFVGDNGTPGNLVQGYSRGKGSLYEGGIHVPMVISGYGVTRNNETEDAMIQVCDLFATMAHFSNESIDETGGFYNSMSFKHMLQGDAGNKRMFNYTELGKKDKFPRDAYTIRNEQYKILQYVDSVQEFYDLKNDPFESNNLLLGELNDSQIEAREILEQEAITIRTDWSCQDGIMNGNETGIDCGGDCNNCETNQINSFFLSDELDVYPNPFTNKLIIRLNNNESENSVKLYNALGKEEEIQSNRKGNTLIINTKNCLPGMYFITVSDSKTKKARIGKVVRN